MRGLLSPVQTDATLLADNSQYWWMLHVTSVCTPCCMLLDVVACCRAKFETGQTFQPTNPNISFVPWSPKRSATMLDPFAQLFQHCWGHVRSLLMVYKDLWVVSFPRCTAGPNIAGSCCIRLHTTANTHATAPSIVGTTMLGVVASVYTQPCTPCLDTILQPENILKELSDIHVQFSSNSFKKIWYLIRNFHFCAEV